MNEETHAKLKEIKQSFRLLMNGVAAQSMREKGLDYHLNWGVALTDLRQMAAEYGKDYELAIELWKENIRECKILATLIMPPEKMLPEIVDIWMEQTHSQEVAEQACFNLYQHLQFAPVLAYQWMAAADEMRQMCGYLVLTRLFMRGQEPNERGINEFLDQAETALASSNSGLSHAALMCVQRFALLGDDYRLIALKALKSYDLGLF
jgi:3-methyladenine DNA glycosylase AlkD